VGAEHIRSGLSASYEYSFIQYLSLAGGTSIFTRRGETHFAAIRAANPEIYQTILDYEQWFDDIPSFDLHSPTAGSLDRRDEWIG
jgi:hypothetical protein